MDYVYFVTRSNRHINYTKRVSNFHRLVYHGTRTYLSETEQAGLNKPALSNSNRERMHISRSGRFVPSVFSPSSNELVISEDIRFRGLGSGEVEFQPVVMEHLVDLPMPEIGERELPDPSHEEPGKKYLAAMPHQPQLEESIGKYHQILMPIHIEMKDRLDDTEKVKPEFGNYYSGRRTVPLSRKLLQRYAMYDAGSSYFVLSEEAFTVIGPFLDLDYYAIAVHSLRPRVYFDMDGMRFSTPDTK